MDPYYIASCAISHKLLAYTHNNAWKSELISIPTNFPNNTIDWLTDYGPQ